MKKYRVYIEQRETFYVDVEAQDKQEADDKANEEFSEGNSTSTGRLHVESLEVEELKD